MDKNIKQRQEFCEILKNKHPDRVPVIIKKGNNFLQDMPQEKYLMPKSLHIIEVIYEKK